MFKVSSEEAAILLSRGFQGIISSVRDHLELFPEPLGTSIEIQLCQLRDSIEVMHRADGD